MIDSDHNFFRSYVEIGTAISKELDYSRSKPFFDRAFELAQSDLDKALVLVEQARSASLTPGDGLEVAGNLLDQASSLAPNAWQVHNSLGVLVMMQNGNPADAKRHFEKAVSLSNGEAEALANLRRLGAD